MAEKLRQEIFKIRTDQEFNELSLKIFRYQYLNNQVYRQYVDALGVSTDSISHYSSIPFLPIEFFKQHSVLCSFPDKYDRIFTSSGTTGMEKSTHYISDIRLYEESFLNCFELFFGIPDQYILIALLPSYLEQENSSLVYMADKLIRSTGHPESGFYLQHNEEMTKIIENADRKVILLGVTYALLDFAENHPINKPDLLILETGGMKGRRREMVREEVHNILCSSFNVPAILSEYGMTELLSQAYSVGEGIFCSPPWMKILARDPNDPLSLLGIEKTGGLNIIDLANIHSCSFIATQDLGKVKSNGFFEVLGRFDSSDIRGCNLMVD